MYNWLNIARIVFLLRKFKLLKKITKLKKVNKLLECLGSQTWVKFFKSLKNDWYKKISYKKLKLVINKLISIFYIILEIFIE